MNTKNLLIALACALGIGSALVGCDSGTTNNAADMAVVARDLTMPSGTDLATPPDMAPACADPNLANPTHAQIINACTTAQAIDKKTNLPADPNCK